MSVAGGASPSEQRTRPLAPPPPKGEKLERHPADVARLVFSVILLAALVALAEIAPLGLRSFTVDVLAVVESLPQAVVNGLIGLVQLTAIVVPAIAMVLLVVRRRFVLLALCLLAAVLAAVIMALLGNVVEESIPFEELGFERASSWFIGSQFPSSAYLAGLTAALVAASPWLAKAWRRAGWVLVVAAVVARALTATEVPLRNVLLLVIGAAAGSAALLIVGAPRRRMDPDTLRAALASGGLSVSGLSPVDGPQGVTSFFGLQDGDPVIVHALGRDQRDTDLLLHTWRNLTVKGLSSEPSLSPRRTVEHEALAMGLFRSAGASAPRPLAIVETPDEAAVMAASFEGGRRMSRLPAVDVSGAMLDNLWTQVALLQRRRLAHRQLNASSIVALGDECTLIDLRYADYAPTDEVLGLDVAELLVSTSCIVGPERAVAHAIDALTAEQLARAAPLVQDAVLTSKTHNASRAVERRDGLKKGALLDDVRDRLAVAAGIEQVVLLPVQRITLKGTIALVGAMVLAAYVLNLASNWDETWDAFTTADVAYIPPIIVMMICTYLAGSWSLMGATSVHLSFTRTSAVMFGQSFLNRFTPANAGGMAMRVRYLQLNGLDVTVAGATIGLTSGASGLAQGILIVVFLIWGGASDRFSDFEFPDTGLILIIIACLGLMAWFVLMTTWGRTVVRPWLGGAYGRVKESFRDVLRSPKQMTRLMGGAIFNKLANVIAFWLSVLAFDVDMSFAKAGALYMIANTIGSAVPTPGGVGGVEAALTAALISFGVDNATAAAIVLLFRTLTFWLPTVPGYFFMRYCQRTGIV
ncbi:MAG: lysylphosphatidylglycerol synthase transmembrane domain-containing protein [Acidimicrobiia bacterium]|nr:lysylphosphatidylglycerol synthase transmembrane domain-containing protein [Acidimicrobiia bacterium]